MDKRSGLLRGEFLLQLHRNVGVVLRNHGPSSSHRLLVDTPTAAEIILAIAESEAFEANGREKNELRALATKIAVRYSGH